MSFFSFCTGLPLQQAVTKDRMQLFSQQVWRGFPLSLVMSVRLESQALSSSALARSSCACRSPRNIKSQCGAVLFGGYLFCGCVKGKPRGKTPHSKGSLNKTSPFDGIPVCLCYRIWFFPWEVLPQDNSRLLAKGRCWFRHIAICRFDLSIGSA